MPMTPDMHDIGTGDALATMADQFGQLAVSLADGADQPLTQQRLVEFAVRGIPGAEHASMTVVDGHRPPRTTAQQRRAALSVGSAAVRARRRTLPGGDRHQRRRVWRRTCARRTGGRGSPAPSWIRPRRGACSVSGCS